jgi:Gp49-like protein DUF891
VADGLQAVLFASPDGTCPILQWLDQAPPKVQDKFVAAISLMQELGGNFLSEDLGNVRRLPVRCDGSAYHLFYFLDREGCVVLLHASMSNSESDPEHVETAVNRRAQFERNPGVHTFIE